MSESEEHPDDPEHDDAPEGANASGEDDFEDDDLDDLDALGVDGVVAQMTGDEPPRRKQHRPPWVSALVVLACLYPLVSMWGDFRYWLRDAEPEPLGDSIEIFEPGAAVPDLANRYVTIEGTPDVQWASVLTKKSGAKVSYLRVLEGGGRLFAAVPRPARDDATTPEYPSTFTGRVSRFGDARAYGWVARLYADEGVTQLFDVTAEAIADAAAAGDASLRLPTTDGRTVIAEADDRIRIVTRRDDARVLLGVESFPDAEAAQAAIAALGYPYISLGEGRTDLRRYVVRIPAAKREAARKALLAKVEGEIDESDPKEGVSVFPLSATYTAPAGEFSVEGDALVFPYGDNTTSPGYTERAGALVEAELDGGRLRIPLSEVHSARVEKPVFVDPDGYLIEVGVDPSSQLKWAILWLLVLAVALTNAGILVASARRRMG
ncbi:MAG: hypothetical protein ACE37F_34765 [Nannocystaceae bacterium]|nr:hypothetical protein [bacterium]